MDTPNLDNNPEASEAAALSCARKRIQAPRSLDGGCESHAGLEEIAERGKEQLREHQAAEEPGSAAEKKETIVESELGAGQDTEPLTLSTSGGHPLISLSAIGSLTLPAWANIYREGLMAGRLI